MSSEIYCNSVNNTYTPDVTIVGGGIVGLAVALSLSSRFPSRRVLLLEKELQLAEHQSGHNSGVIHSGIYYRPGSMKAKLCQEGIKTLITFCQKHAIPYQICGKIIVATHPSELPELQALYERGCANGVKGLALIGPQRLHEIEPHAFGLKAIHVPGTGIVDFRQVAHAYADLARQQGVVIRTSARLKGLLYHHHQEWIIQSATGDFRSKYLINCGGLQADRIAWLARVSPNLAIIPFRGEYYEILPERCSLVKGLIYPVPNPLFPFLGVHFTRTIAGKVKVGPNAVLALKREGYRKTDIDLRDLLQLLSYPGFWGLLKRHGHMGLREMVQSFSKKAFAHAAKRLLPELELEDLTPAGTGVRAQAVNQEGSLLDDFRIVKGQGAIHVLNVPSPAATASLRIGEVIAEMAGNVFFS